MNRHSESELSEPFESSGTDYKPSDEDRPSSSDSDAQVVLEIVAVDNNGETSVKRGRKRTRKMAEWARNVQKFKRARGETYISTSTGKSVLERKQGSDCKCAKECIKRLSEDEKQEILTAFNNLSDQDKQDSYLSSLIKVCPIGKRRKTETAPKLLRNRTYKYKLRKGAFELEVCKLAVCCLHGIGKKRLERIARHLTANVTPVQDKRGRHSNRPNLISVELKTQIHDHISSFPKRISHYSRNNSTKYYLSSDLNISIMHDLYLKKFEPEVHKLKQDGLPYKPKISYDIYGRYFRENFNMSFGTARKDTCKKCDILNNKIRSADSQEETKTFETEKKLHLQKAEWFYKELKEKSKEAEENDEIDVLCFDYQQNMPLPKVPSGDAFYLRQLWVYNFCIHSAKNKTGHFFMYDETVAKKGANDVLSFLKYYFDNIMNQNVKTLYLFSDNCCAQNKNNTLIRFLVTSCYTGRFESIIHRYPEPGHSFLPCDRYFGVIEKKKKSVDRVFLPQDYMKIVKSASKNFHVIPVNQTMVFNYVDHLKQFFMPVLKAASKEKFLITSYRVFKYAKNVKGVECTTSASASFFTYFTMLKNETNPNLDLVPNCYSDKLPIKFLKYQNVMLLADEYVGKNDMHFYHSLLSDKAKSDDISDVTDSSDLDK